MVADQLRKASIHADHRRAAVVRVSEYSLAVWGLVLGVAGIAVGLATSAYFYLKGKQRARLWCEVRDEALWGPLVARDSEFEFSYRGEKIRRARKSTIYLWSEGSNVTVHSSAISSAEPLAVRFPGPVRVLAATASRQVRPASEFTAIVTDHDTVEVSFAFLDDGDGGAIEVLYEPTDSDLIPSGPRVAGAIMGVSGGFKPARNSRRTSHYLVQISASAVLLAGAIMANIYLDLASWSWPLLVAVFFAAGIFYLPLMILTEKKSPDRNPPIDLLLQRQP